MKARVIAICAAGSALLLSGVPVRGQVPSIINYQGRLLNGTNLVNGGVALTLRLYTNSVPVAGEAILYEDSRNPVTVVDGLYSTFIGDDTTQGSLAAALAQREVYLAVTVNGQTLTPRERLASVPYTMVAGGVPPQAITSSMLADQAVTTAKMGTSVVTSVTIVDGSVLTQDLNMPSFAATFWGTGGNAGTTPGMHFIGTTDGQALELKVSGVRAQRIEPDATSPRLIGGHASNSAAGPGAFVGGGGGAGTANAAGANYSTVAGGEWNAIQSGAIYATIPGGYGNRILARSSRSAIGGGGGNTVSEDSWYGVIGGGSGNAIGTNASCAVLGGGQQNDIWPRAEYATLGGGRDNDIGEMAWNATVAGGRDNHILERSMSSAIGGGSNNTIAADTGNCVIGGGRDNTVEQSVDSMIAGGGGNRIGSVGYAPACVIGGGYSNAIAGGANWMFGIRSDGGTIAGGIGNVINPAGYGAVISGGMANLITPAGGNLDTPGAVIAGGVSNEANGYCAAVLGGSRNRAVGLWSFAAGYRAKSVHSGAFVWADSTEADYNSPNLDTFSVRARGGVFMDTGTSPGISLNAANAALITRGYDAFSAGTHLGAGRWGLFMEPHRLVAGIPAIGGKEFHVARYNEDSSYTSLVSVDQSGNLYTLGAVNPPSDRNVKTEFATVEPERIVAAVAAMPIGTWRYKDDAAGARHMGPVAQDFRAAFGLGTDDRHIATVDADGVALAAVQGLYRMIRERDRRIGELEERLNRLEAALNPTAAVRPTTP